MWSLRLDKKVGGAAGPCFVAPGDKGRNDLSRSVICREVAPQSLSAGDFIWMNNFMRYVTRTYKQRLVNVHKNMKK